MINGIHNDNSSAPIERGHAHVLAALPEYVTQIALKQPLGVAMQPISAHLAKCSVCRSEANALLRLINTAYAGELAPQPAPAKPDLRFLRTGERPISADDMVPLEVVEVPRWTFQFSEALLAQIAVQMRPRTEGMQLRYSYEIVPPDDPDSGVTIEVFTSDSTEQRGLVRICVELSDQNPFDQSGTSVALFCDGECWNARTDHKGIVLFPNIPLDHAAQWRITVTPVHRAG